MIKAWKSYWAFTNGIYKVLILFVLPVLLIVVDLLLLKFDAGTGIELLLILYGIDSISDHFFIGGFYKKNNASFEFLQSSNRFSRLAKDVVCVDAVRRVLLYQIPYVVTLLWVIGDTENLMWWSTMAYLPWLLALGAQLVSIVSRHFTVWNQVYACSAVGLLVLCPVLIATFWVESIHWSFCLVLIACEVLVGWGTCLYTDKKVRESYYDK